MAPRIVALTALSSAIAFFLALASGCLGEAPVGGPDGGGHDLAASQGQGDLSAESAPDLARPAPRMVPDLATYDLTGFTNCFGVAICDPNQMFCIRYWDGSQTTPGQLTPPACYEPSDTCGNQGQNMDCGCIQNDAQLGTYCQGACVDHQDGTFDCYAQ